MSVLPRSTMYILLSEIGRGVGKRPDFLLLPSFIITILLLSNLDVGYLNGSLSHLTFPRKEVREEGLKGILR